MRRKPMQSKAGVDFIAFSVPATLMSTWAVWTPAVVIIYCLPPPLQIPLFNLVPCFWVIDGRIAESGRHPRPEETR
jgi:hypothetical protein